MLVQALAEYAATYLPGDLAVPAFEEKSVRYFLKIDLAGAYRGIHEQKYDGGRSPVGKIPRRDRGKSLFVPRSPVNRNKGIYPLLACDRLSYVLGFRPGVWSREEERCRHTEHHDGFLELLRLAAMKTEDKGLTACLAFYANREAVTRAALDLAALRPKASSLICLSLIHATRDCSGRGEPVISRPEVRRFWIDSYNRSVATRHDKGGKGMCLITGEYGSLAVTHGLIKGTSSIGGLASGAALISFDKPAFRSYGWEKSTNCPINPTSATAYVLALNNLLKLGAHHQGRSGDVFIPTRSDYGDLALLYWTRRPFDEAFVPIVERADLVALDRLLLMLPFKEDSLQEDSDGRNELYLLAISGNGGRLVVHDWLSVPLEKVVTNIKSWFDDMAIDEIFTGGKLAKAPSLPVLLRAVTPPWRTLGDKANSRILLSFMRRALRGIPLDRLVLAAAIGRQRSANRASRMAAARIGIIRICLNDIYANQKRKLFLNQSLNPQENNIAYLCGRLFAITETLQSGNNRRVVSPVNDRYYAMASTQPFLMFKHLKSLLGTNSMSRSISKVESVLSLMQCKNEVVARIGNHFSNVSTIMTLEEQGIFFVGYHHQKVSDSTPNFY